MANRMRFAAVTLFPEMFEAITRFGISRRAFETGISQFTAHNPRDFATDRYKTIDDRPFGGGPGMVMMPEPLEKSIDAAVEAVRRRVSISSSTARAAATGPAAGCNTQWYDTGATVGVPNLNDGSHNWVTVPLAI